MNRRTLVWTLVVGGSVIVLAVLVWLWRARTTSVPSTTGKKPGAATSTKSVPETLVPTQTKPVAGSPEERERQAEEVLKRQGLSFAARQGTYSSVDGFAAVKDVYLEATPALRDFLEKARLALVSAHPSFGPVWGQTTHALSVRISSALPVIGKSTAQVTVQAQQTIERSDAASVISYQQIVLDFDQANGRWLVSRVTVQPFQP